MLAGATFIYNLSSAICIFMLNRMIGDIDTFWDLDGSIFLPCCSNRRRKFFKYCICCEKERQH
jgi:hypothetical protein